MSSAFSWLRGIKGKLLLAAAVPVVGFIISGIITFDGIRKLTGLLNSAHDYLIPSVETLTEMQEERNKFGFRILGAISGHNLGRPDHVTEDIASSKEALQAFESQYAAYLKTPFMPEEEEKFKNAEASFKALIATMEKIQKLMDSKEPENFKEAEQVLHSEMDTHAAVVHKYVEEVLEIYHARVKNESATAHQTQASVDLWTLIVLIASSIFAFTISSWIAFQVAKVLSSIGERLETASTSVSTSVEQLSAAGSTLSQSSTEAAASLEETVASLEEMTSMVQMNSDNAKQAAALSATSRDAAEKGEHEIESLIKAMNEIATSSKKIEEIISVIDDIAFQTNLLALNASVEAARAGEQGKGFAVVADAVRALAQRSADAAKDINVLIKDSVQKVDQGGKIAGQSGAVLHNIVTSVKKVSDLNTEIATASAEQTAGIQQISKAMNQLDQASQSNAASAEEIAATSSEISNLAITSQNLTLELGAVIHGTYFSAEKDSVAKQHIEPVHKFKAPKANNVVSFTPAKQTSVKKKVTAAKESSQDIIPFDDEENHERAKVGTTSGF